MLGVPAVGTGDPLVVTFDRPLDHGLLQHCLEVVDADGDVVAGRTRTPSGEQAWEFTPDEPWTARAHRLTVDPMLEDLAGNSLRRVFDRDLSDAHESPDAAPVTSLDFAPT